MDLTSYFTTLARYNVWATGRLLDAVAALPEDDYRRDVGLFFKSIHGTLNHLRVADNIWFPRFAEGRSPRMALNAELEPDRARLAARLRADATRWAPLIGTFAAPQWQGMLNYVTTQGVPTSVPFTPTLGLCLPLARMVESKMSPPDTTPGLRPRHSTPCSHARSM